jgi:hypothetical protein
VEFYSSEYEDPKPTTPGSVNPSEPEHYMHLKLRFTAGYGGPHSRRIRQKK